MQQKHLTLLFLKGDSGLLLAMKKRGFGAGKYNGVGGKVESGETIEAAMIREAREEIAVEPTMFTMVGDITFDEYFKGVPTLMRVYVFVATAWQGTPTESEEMNPEWFALDHVPYETMWSDDRFWLPYVLDGKKISANFTLDETDRIVSHDVRIVEDLSVPSLPKDA